MGFQMTPEKERILKLPIDQWELDKETYQSIMDCTECTRVGDLWEISAKELCLFCGLNKQQVKGLIDKMNELNYRRRHMEQCELNLRLYWDSIPD